MRVTSSVDGVARRWYSHRYNRPDLYGLAARLGWLPRPLRLALARQIGRLAPRLVPAERAAIRETLAQFTNATGSRLDALTAQAFVDFAMCFSDLVSTNRQPRVQLAAYVAGTEGVERLRGLTGGFISLTAHVGNWELAGRLLAGQCARPTHVVVAPEEMKELERWVRRDGKAFASLRGPVRRCRSSWSPRCGAARSWPSRAIGHSVVEATR